MLIGALLLGGCGGGDDRPQVPGDGALTIYTSLPMQGASARTAEAVGAGQRLALADHKGRAGGHKIRLVALDSSKPDGQTWDPSLVEKNAKLAAKDASAVAYLGELDRGGSAVSLPVTNAKGILQISPLDGLTSLTREQPGGPRGGPERFYPSGARTFARLVPVDLMQATMLVDWARERGSRSVAIVHDDRAWGRAIAGQAVFVAAARGITVTIVREVKSAANPPKPADDAKALAEAKVRPDAVIYAGLADASSAPLLAAIQQALPAADLYAAGVPADAELDSGGTLRIVSDARPARYYGPKAARILARIGPDTPVAALYGYESMRLVLEAIDHSGADRAAVVREALRPGPQLGALGRIDLTRSGDLADQRVALYRRDATGLTFEGLRASVPPALEQP
ncbi:MAG: branched-chain amino acid transport system substrate-binding protein [Thermoleophilales bacterium]|nr:branched-chain amino acid transport system substrate-binding protein [Thermoleophilales bacterium]